MYSSLQKIKNARINEPSFESDPIRNIKSNRCYTLLATTTHNLNQMHQSSVTVIRLHALSICTVYMDGNQNMYDIRTVYNNNIHYLEIRHCSSNSLQNHLSSYTY